MRMYSSMYATDIDARVRMSHPKMTSVLVFICLCVCACAYLHQGCRYDGVNLSHVYMCRIWLGPLDGMDLEISIACVRQDSAGP